MKVLNLSYYWKNLKLVSLTWDNDFENNSSEPISGTNPTNFIKTKPNFSMILVKLREILFSTVPTKIDDKNLKKNIEQ